MLNFVKLSCQQSCFFFFFFYENRKELRWQSDFGFTFQYTPTLFSRHNHCWSDLHITAEGYKCWPLLIWTLITFALIYSTDWAILFKLNIVIVITKHWSKQLQDIWYYNYVAGIANVGIQNQIMYFKSTYVLQFSFLGPIRVIPPLADRWAHNKTAKCCVN